MKILTILALTVAGLFPQISSHAQEDVHRGVEEAVALDRMQAEAARQLEFFRTLGEISAAVAQMAPYRDVILAILDGDRPAGSRWRHALESLPEPAAAKQADPAEIVQLRAEIDALRASLAALENAPMPLPVPAVEEMDSPADSPPEPEWDLNRNTVRYVQMPAGGADAAVYLAVRDTGVRIGQGDTAALAGKAVRLQNLERQPGGRIRLDFRVDGKPAEVIW